MTLQHVNKIVRIRPIAYNSICRINTVPEPWDWEHEVPPKLRDRKVNPCDLDGFGSNWKKHWKLFETKLKKNEAYRKNLIDLQKNNPKFDDYRLVSEAAKRDSKSNIRKLRKTKIKTREPEDISTDQAAEYLKVLARIREGVKKPQTKKIEKHLPNVIINTKKLKKYLKRIGKLNIMEVINIEKQSLLPSKTIIDEQCDELDKIYNQITTINNSEDNDSEFGKNSLFHLDLYSKLLLSFGKIGRIHQMVSIYLELKHCNLQITNDTLIEMLDIVHTGTLTKQLWHEYLNDFRKGKIPERPTHELFHAFMKNYATQTDGSVHEPEVLFKMMTEEFNIAPDVNTILYLLQNYNNYSPPRYKSAQKLFAKMKSEYKITPTIQHYTLVLSIISTKWDHFSNMYKDLEEVDNKYLSNYKYGVNFKRCLKLFNTILKDKSLEINSDLFSAIFKGCANSKMIFKEKGICIDALFKKYVLLESNEDESDVLNERFLEISNVKLKSDVCSEILKLYCQQGRDHEKVQEYYKIFTENDKIKDRFIIDHDLFCVLINAISCDLRGSHKAQMSAYEQIAMDRIEWIENEMDKYDILANKDIWYHWLVIAKRLGIPNITKYLLNKMNDFMENVLYFEFDVQLFQSVVEALHTNGNMDKALEIYGKYYKDIKLFTHWELKNTGQKEIDFHGFRTGTACVGLQWILQYEYPPLNISKYLLEQYGNKNPNVSIIIGQGHHNEQGQSILYKALMKHIASLSPGLQASRYPNNPGQLVINGDDVARWRRFHGYQVDVLKVNDNLQMRLFI